MLYKGHYGNRASMKYTEFSLSNKPALVLHNSVALMSLKGSNLMYADTIRRGFVLDLDAGKSMKVWEGDTVLLNNIPYGVVVFSQGFRCMTYRGVTDIDYSNMKIIHTDSSDVLTAISTQGIRTPIKWKYNDIIFDLSDVIGSTQDGKLMLDGITTGIDASECKPITGYKVKYDGVEKDIAIGDVFDNKVVSLDNGRVVLATNDESVPIEKELNIY